MELLNDKDAKIDKVYIYGFYVTDIKNIDILIEQNIVTVNLMKKKYLVTISNEEYSSINIDKTDLFDQFLYGLSKDGHEYGCLQISVSESLYGNLNCLSANDYRERVKMIKAYLYDVYGIDVIFDNAKYKSMELNKTILIDSPFEDYKRVLELMVSLFPAKLRLKKENSWLRYIKNNNIMKCKRVLETYIRSSGEKGITIEIYDKTTELNEVCKTEIKYDYLRFEIKLKSPNKIKGVFGNNSIWEMEDMDINKYFSDFISLYVEKPYAEYCIKRDRILQKILKRCYVKNCRTWIRDTILTICNIELDNNIPLMLSINELVRLLDVLPFDSKQIKYNVKARFKKLAKERIEIFNRDDDFKYVEIINKLK